MDGTVITDLRTAAASACAIKAGLLGRGTFSSFLFLTSIRVVCSKHSNSFTALPAYAHPLPMQALVPKPPSVLCIVGTGGQARSHAEAFRVCHFFTEVSSV